MKFFLPFLTLILITGCTTVYQPTEKKTTVTSSFENMQEHVSDNLNTTIIDVANCQVSPRCTISKAIS